MILVKFDSLPSKFNPFFTHFTTANTQTVCPQYVDYSQFTSLNDVVISKFEFFGTIPGLFLSATKLIHKILLSQSIFQTANTYGLRKYVRSLRSSIRRKQNYANFWYPFKKNSFTNLHFFTYVHIHILPAVVKWRNSKLRGLSPRADYTDRAAAAGRRS